MRLAETDVGIAKHAISAATIMPQKRKHSFLGVACGRAFRYIFFALQKRMPLQSLTRASV